MQECKLITIKLKREAKSETKSHLHGQPLPPSPQLDQWSVTLCRTARMFSKNRWWKGLAKDWERLIMSIEAREEDHHLTTLSTQFTRPFPLQFFLLSPGFWVLVTEHQSHSDSVSSQASLSSSESEKKEKKLTVEEKTGKWSSKGVVRRAGGCRLASEANTCFERANDNKPILFWPKFFYFPSRPHSVVCRLLLLFWFLVKPFAIRESAGWGDLRLTTSTLGTDHQAWQHRLLPVNHSSRAWIGFCLQASVSNWSSPAPWTGQVLLLYNTHTYPVISAASKSSSRLFLPWTFYFYITTLLFSTLLNSSSLPAYLKLSLGSQTRVRSAAVVTRLKHYAGFFTYTTRSTRQQQRVMCHGPNKDFNVNYFLLLQAG